MTQPEVVMDIRARLLQFSSQPVTVDTTEMGPVYIRRLTLRELDEMQQEGKALEGKTAKPGDPAPLPITVKLLARFLGNDVGAPVFDMTKAEDRDALLGFPVAVASEILREGNRINKMGNAEEKPKNA